MHEACCLLPVRLSWLSVVCLEASEWLLLHLECSCAACSWATDTSLVRTAVVAAASVRSVRGMYLGWFRRSGQAPPCWEANRSQAIEEPLCALTVRHVSRQGYVQVVILDLMVIGVSFARHSRGAWCEAFVRDFRWCVFLSRELLIRLACGVFL